MLDELSAREILDATHAAWSVGDVDGMLRPFSDDMVYWSNAGGPDGGALTITGKAGFREFLLAVRETTESVTVSEYFRLIDGVGRAQIEGFLRHKQTGHTLVGSYRQVITFKNGKIARIEEYHDAARMAAFWRLITGAPDPQVRVDDKAETDP